MELIEQIGPILGAVSFAALALLALLLIQQSRDIRRLREWAGRAPERSADAVEAAQRAAEARTEAQRSADADAAAEPASRLAAARAAVSRRWQRFDRRLPLDARLVLAAFAAGAVAAGALSGGFGLLDGSDGGDRKARRGAKAAKREAQSRRPEVAVLNATQQEGVQQGVSGLAATISREVVADAGYRAGRTDNAASGEPESVIMFEPEHERAAKRLARAVEPELGPTETAVMIQEVRERAGGANVVLIVGRDDAGY